MLAILPALLLWHHQTPATPRDKPIEVHVLVVNYDPRIPSEGNQPLHLAKKWNDPHKLADGYISDIREASGGYVNYVIKEWRDRDEIPAKKDGYRYSTDEFMDIFTKKNKDHQPDGVDYVKVLEDNRVGQAIDSGKIDEVWVFGAPFFGFWESTMAGPGAYFINGDPIPEYKSKRRFAIMGFSYERGVAEMIHDLSHRVENHLSRVYGGWHAWPLTSMWDRFSAYAKTSHGQAGVGNCHFPPNAVSDYDYANPATVQSNADDWLTYPKLTGATKLVNKETWGGPDYQRNYLKWWFSHVPKRAGSTPDGRQMNWWKYVFRFNDYDEHGQPLRDR